MITQKKKKSYAILLAGTYTKLILPIYEIITYHCRKNIMKNSRKERKNTQSNI